MYLLWNFNEYILPIALAFEFMLQRSFDCGFSVFSGGELSHETSIIVCAEDSRPSFLTPKAIKRNHGSTKNASTRHQSSCLYCG